MSNTCIPKRNTDRYKAGHRQRHLQSSVAAIRIHRANH